MGSAPASGAVSRALAADSDARNTRTGWRLLAVSTNAKTNSVQSNTKGQVVIPSWLRREFQIEEGTRAIVIGTPDGILLMASGPKLYQWTPGQDGFREVADFGPQGLQLSRIAVSPGGDRIALVADER